MAPIIIDYAPRKQFLPFHRRKQRWAVLVCHRRAGKTVATINDVIRRAVVENKPDGRYAFVAPYYNQVKDLAWTYLKNYARPILAEPPREAELSVLLVNGARIRLYGSDNPDRLRGIYLDGVVIDEFGDVIPALWTDVLRPTLSDRNGWAVFIGTPKGKNDFYDRWVDAQKNPDEWFSVMLKASETGITPAHELEEMRKQMGEDGYNQELECSFDAAIKGAFYADEMRVMAAEGRIRPIEIDPLIRVHTGWDIGRTDSTAIWFIQCVGRERRLVDYHESSGHIITHYADVLYDKKREHGWQYGEHFFPHDMAFKMIDAEKSRLGQMQAKGIDGQVVPAHDVLEGVNVVRKMLGRTYIDPTRCERGLEALRQYRRQWDANLNDWKAGEHKDWTNHCCFAGETEVLTRYGKHQIKDLPQTGEVLTLCGWQQYENPRVTRINAPLVEVRFTNGLSVKCTADHMFLTESGWKSAERLQSGTRIRSSLMLSRSISMAVSIGFSKAKNISQRVARNYILPFGDQCLALCRAAAISTIKITTAFITPLKTLSVFPPPNICLSHGITGSRTVRNMDFPKPPANALLIGTSLMREGCGIDDMPCDLNLGTNGNASLRNVRGAARSLIASLGATAISKNTAQTYARWSLIENAAPKSGSPIEFAKGVARSLIILCKEAVRIGCSALSIARGAISIESVTAIEQQENVWCLTVPDASHFSLGNGAIVHNCDAIRTFSVGFDDPSILQPEGDRHRSPAPSGASSWAA